MDADNNFRDVDEVNNYICIPFMYNHFELGIDYVYIILNFLFHSLP